MKAGNRNFGLDFVRAVAISLVIISHFAKTQESFGFFGVEIFFALSGFLIGNILWKNYSSSGQWTFKQIKNFWQRRWWRTLPNYYLFLLINLVFSYYMTGGIPAFKEFSTFLWFGQDLLSRNYGFYSVSWSLCIEEWFYLLFPLVLFVFSKFNFKVHTTFWLTLFFFFVLFPFIRLTLINYGKGSQLREITSARLDAIGFGVMITYIQSVSNLKLRKKQIMFFVGVLFIFMPLFVSLFSGISLALLSQNKQMLVIVPLGTALSLPLISLIKTPSGRLHFLDVCIEKVSLWSYSIYLSHIPILFFVYYLLKDIRATTLGNLFSKGAGLLITIIASAFIYRFFEVPLTNKRSSELRVLPEKANI